MIALLAKWLIPNHENTSDGAVRRAYGQLCGFVGIGLNILLFAGKFFAGTLIGSIAVLSITALQRPLLITLFDSRAAATMGIPTRAFNYGIFALIILVLVSSLQAVGSFLTLGLLVAPAATMYLLTDRASWLFWGGGLIGGLGAIAAFFLSYPLGWHLGATIIVVLGAIFLLAYLFSPRYGLFRSKSRKAAHG